MVKPLVGDVVIVHFPFSDLSGEKRRPALTVGMSEFDACILCQITSKKYASQSAIELLLVDFEAGTLPILSYIRPDKIFTANTSIIDKTVGHLYSSKISAILLQIRQLFNEN